jgi:beta-barrel assembly-enhancing protease
MRLLPLIALIGSLAAPAGAQPAFTFTKVDLKLLDEANAIDKELENRGLVYHDAVINARVTEIGRSLIPPGKFENVRWQFHVLRDPMVNAFALPNGSIYIDSGLLARAENDDQVAGVLAHEATHVANRHGYLANRTVRRRSAIMTATSWLTVIPAGGIAGAAILVGSAAGQAAIVLSIYGYSRELEREADISALEHMKRAGRDPAQLERMLVIFDAKLEPEPIPILYNDHPKTRHRIDYLKERLGAAADAATAEDRAYGPHWKPVLAQNVQLDIDSRRFRSAVAGAARLTAAEPADAGAWFLAGEAWRSLGPRRPTLSEEELTPSQQRAGYRAARKLTEEEETRKLADTEDGRAALRESRARAEEAYRRAAALDPAAAHPYLGLGSLFQDEGKSAEAIAAYRRCVELSAPGSADRERASRRIAALTGDAQ